nr:glycosyltransferase [uncultured Schaedlerella sp.]
MPRVSIVIPVYNVEKYLKECLDSVQNQTLRDMEIICIDDGSTDSSGAILDRYASQDPRFKIIHKKNEGYGKSMNIGIGLATAPYVGIVESDDWVAPDMYEKLLKLMEEQQVDVIKTDFYRFYDNGEGGYIEQYVPLIIEKRLWDLYNKKICTEDHEEVFQFHRYTWTGLYNKDFLSKTHILHNETPGASYQDNGFWFQTMVKAKSLYFSNQAFYRYRIDNLGSSMNSKGKAYAICDEYDFVRDTLVKMGEAGKKYYRWASYIKITDCIQTLARVADEYKEGLALRIKKEFFDAKQGDIDPIMYSDSWKLIMFELFANSKAYIEKENEKNFRIRNIDSTYDRIIIYGAGKIGQAVLSFLKERRLQTKIKYIAVTETDNNPQFISGIPVKKIENLRNYKSNALIIISVGQRAFPAVKTILQTENFQHLLKVNDLMEPEVLKEYFERNENLVI